MTGHRRELIESERGHGLNRINPSRFYRYGGGNAAVTFGGHFSTVTEGVGQIRGEAPNLLGKHTQAVSRSWVCVLLFINRQCPTPPDKIVAALLLKFPSPEPSMRSEKVELRLAHEISEAAKIRAEEEGYRNCKRYVTGLMVEDIMHPRRHSALVHTIANSDPELQDALLDQFLKVTRFEISQIMIAAVKIRKKARSV